MMGLISFVHIAVCLLLIVIVLLQNGKGADAGAAFGGGQSAVFGARGAASFLSKVTTVGAIIFMVTSLMLVYLSAQKASQTVFKDSNAATVTTPSEALEDGVEEGTQQAQEALDNTIDGISEDAEAIGQQAGELAEDAKQELTDAKESE